MLILSQDKNVVVNVDNLACVRVAGTYIHAYLVDGTDVSLAAYDTEEKARKVFEQTFVKNSVIASMP